MPDTASGVLIGPIDPARVVSGTTCGAIGVGSGEVGLVVGAGASVGRQLATTTTASTLTVEMILRINPPIGYTYSTSSAPG
jgi:hypothetical protein